jgi:hypothetical protein
MKSFEIFEYSAGRRAAAVLKPCILGSHPLPRVVVHPHLGRTFLVISFTGSVRSFML